MRYFKIVLACFGFIFAVVGITAGVLFLTGKFDKTVIQPDDIAFEITEKLTEDDFEVVVNTTTENVTEKDVTLSLTNQTETDGMISDGVITIPKVVKLGKPFTVKVNKTHYAGMTEEWNVGGTSIIRAKSTNPLIQEATPLTVEVDVPVHSLGVELVTTTGTKIGTVSARDLKNYMRTLAEGDEDKKVVELAVGSVVRLQPVFTPAKSAKTTKGEQRKVLFEIPTAWKGIHIDFVDGENDLIEVLRQTTVEDIKINAYCFRTSADEYEAQNQGYSDEELITIMNSNGISGESAQIFGTNQKITSFTSSTNDEYMTLAINTPLTLVANGNVDNAFNLGLGLASDAGVAKLEDKIAVIKLFAYWQNADGAWEDAGDKLEIVGQTSSKKENGVKAKINKNDANLSSWKVIASETGKYKIVAQLSYEYYSSSSSVPTEINFEIPFNNILVADPISSDVAWKSTLPAIKTLVVLDGETAAEKYYPTINLADFVDIKNPNATYKVVRFFAYSTEGENLANVINCSLYSGNFAVPDSSNQYEVFEIPNGILTAKDVGNFRIFFATVVSDYMGNPKIQFGEYLFESFSNTNTINVVKSLKQLDASMTVNEQEDGKDYNKNTDENTRDYVFHVRQQDEKVFTLSLFVSDIDIFERDYADGKISIDFLLGGQKSNILSLTGDYTIDIVEKRVDFQVSVNSLPNNDQPTLECKITYDLDHRLDKFVSNNGNKVQIKVLNGFAQEIVFDAVKDANPRNSAENPIQVEIKFNAGSDNVATNIEYEITLNGQKLILEDLSKVTINDEALNKTYTLTSSKPAVIAVEDSLEGSKLSILGATEDEDVVVTATAVDGSGLSTSLYFRVLASLQIALTPEGTEITIDGYQGNQINFRSYFDAKAGDIDLNNLLDYNVPIENTDKFAFADDTLRVVSTLGRDASLQLYITSDFGFTKIIPIRVVSNITASSTYAFNDNGLDDNDFVARGETPPTERGTRVYAENSREISFVLTQEKPTSTNIAVSVDDFELPKNGGIQNISYNNGILTICFDAVSQMTEKTIIFKKNFSENDEYAFVYTMKFLVFPNIKASLVSNVGTEENPANYISGETIVYDAKDNSKGLIKLERILGANTISEHATLEAKINGEWIALSSSSGAFMLPASFRATEGSFVEIRVTYDGCVLTPIRLFFKPFFDESILLDAKVLYGGKLYVPFIADGENSIVLTQAEGVVYTIINATSEQYLRIRANQIEKLDRLYTKIITSEKLRIENGNGVTELPILILPLKYPFVIYDSIENAENQETYRNVDLKQVIESESFYDTLEAGSEENIDLKSKILVDGLEDGGALISIVNEDGSTNSYVNFDTQNLTISANSVGKDQIVYVKVKCGAEFEEAFEFVYRIKISANQQIKVFYPYIEYNEEYNVDKAYEYLYFGSKSQISVDLMEEFDADKTPNKDLLEELFPTTNGKTYARRFVVVREKDGTLIPLEYKDLHFEIANVVVGGAAIPADKAANYAIINEKTTTNGVIQSANLLINRADSFGVMYVTIRAYTSSGAEAFYRFQIDDQPISYSTYYKGQKVGFDGFSVASDGKSDINLNENVVVKVGENPEQPVSPNEYKFYLIVHEKLGTDYSQFISLTGGHIQISALVNDVETTIVIYNKAGEISRFNLVLKCTIDHEVISTTIGADGVFDIGENVDFFNATSADGNYSMKEISTRLYVRDYLNGTDIGNTTPNNLFVNVGGYSIRDISKTKNYKQYVLLDNLKVYAENLFDTWEGKFYLGDDARYEVLTGDNGEFIRYNGDVIGVKNNQVAIPLQSRTDSNTVIYTVKTDEANNKNRYVIIPHLKFSKGNDTRDYVLYDMVVYDDDLTKTDIEPYGVRLQTKKKVASCTTYVNAYVNEYIRYKVEKDEKDNLKVSILRVTHNNVQYTALVDENHNDDEYIVVDGIKHYFTRFYTINFDGIAENKTDENGAVLNVPNVRYMLTKKDGTYSKEIDLTNIIFYTQEGMSDNVLKLGAAGTYVDGMFQFFKMENGNESQLFVSENQEETENKWIISIANYEPINLVIKDTTGKYVVGRLTILPTVETSTSEKESNKTIFIEAGDTTKVDYTITADAIIVGSYAEAMSPYKSFTGKIATDHPGWTEYVYAVSSTKYNDLTPDNQGNISGLSGQAPWGDITVEAKLKYSSSDKNKTLTTTLSFETWKNKILGEYSGYVTTYAELNALLGDDYRINIESSGNVNGEGNITDVAYGEPITISLEVKCSTCGEWAVVGKEHKHWLENGSEQITDISMLTDEQKETISEKDGKVEILDENDQAKKYVYALTAGSTLQYITSTDEITGIETGEWTLTGKITKTTYVEKSVGTVGPFEKWIPMPVTEQISDISMFTDEQKDAISKGGTVEIVDQNDSTKKYVYALTEGSTLEYIMGEDGAAGEWTLTGTITKTTCIKVVIANGVAEVTTARLDLSPDGYAILAKALFGEKATILGYADWDALLTDCDVEFAGYDENTKTFGGQKEINITLTTKEPKHTGTFYIVNQEYDKETLHVTGNLDKIGSTLTGVASNIIADKVNQVGDRWVLPMATTKTLKSDAILEKLEGGKGTFFDLVENWWGVTEQDITNSKNFASTPFNLGTAASLAGEDDPFNTITIYQHGYAIGNVHIYLEDYYGDDSGSKIQIYETYPKSSKYLITNKNGDSISFNVSNGELTTELTKVVDQKEEISYITQNAKMTNNKYLFENGLLVEQNGTTIILKKINNKHEIKFSFDGVEFVVGKAGVETSKNVYDRSLEGFNLNYFEGLKDIVEQPTSSEIEKGSKTYKAEKTGDDSLDGDVVYKDKIEGEMFGFDKWEYITRYKNESNQTMEVAGKTITVVGLGDEKQIIVTINNITDVEGNRTDGYTFVIDLSEKSAVTIEGGGENITSPDTPYDGGVLTSGQTKDIDIKQILKIDENLQRIIEIKGYAGEIKDENGELNKESLVKALYDNQNLYYLIGRLGEHKSNVFKITKSENDTAVVTIRFTGAEEQEYRIENDGSKYSLVDMDGNRVDETFVLELNEDLYDFEADIEPEKSGSTGEDGNSSEGATTPTNEGESANGESSDEGEEQPTTINVLKITITPVFTYGYKIESNIKLIGINEKSDSKNDENQSIDFAESGILKVTGKEIKTESVVKLRFFVLRGRGNDAKEVAAIYYSLSLKPSVGAVITYPTISTVDGEIPQETEYFYAGAGEFDIKAKSDISIGDEPRMKVMKYAYGTATTTENENTTTYPCVATYEGTNLTIIKIGERNVNWSTTVDPENNVLTGTVENDGKKYTISVYDPKPTISYIASSNQNIIEGKDKNNNDILTNNWKDVEGKFNFEFDDKVSVSEAEVVISAQAEINNYTYIFAQYSFTVCKNPVISTLITTEEGHLDGNGAEILPINGKDALTPFNAARGYVEIDGTRYEVTKNNETATYEVVVGSESYSVTNGQITIGAGENAKTYKVVYYNVINNSPRLQFVYNNLILSSGYDANFEIKDKTPTTKIRDYSISQKKTGESTVYFVYKGQDVSGSYSYKTVWDYKMNPNLDNHTIMGNYDSSGELLNYYYLEAGKEYNIVKTFGITRYFGEEFTTGIQNLKFVNNNKLNEETSVDEYHNVELMSGGQSINVLGAPEGGMNFRIKFQPYGGAADEFIGITITSTLKFNVNYKKGATYDDDNTYGLISYKDLAENSNEYKLVENQKGLEFSIERSGVTAKINANDFPMTIVLEETDESLGAKIAQDNQNATLTIAHLPILNSKRVVIKVSDRYGYVQYLRFVIGAKTQVEVSTSDITFTTGNKIEWNENNPFPIGFQKVDEETAQLASFYESTITGATSANTSDSYGSDSSLKIENGKLYGVQLNSVITKNDNSTVERFIPSYQGGAVSYDLYKLAEQDGIVLKSFDKYSKVEIYKGNSTTADYTWTKGGSNLDDWPLDVNTGALTPIQNVSQYTIKLYSSSTKVAGTIKFTLLPVTKTSKLYYASRTNPTDCYTFDYDISIDGTNIVHGDENEISNIGNAQYGSEKSLNTTLKIGVYEGEKSEENTTPIDIINIGILLKFGIYPEVQQQVSGLTSYDYVGLDDDIQTILTSKTSNIALKSSQAGFVAPDKKYSTVLGKTPTTSLSGTASKMGSGTLTLTSYGYDSSTRVLSLKKALNNDNKAEINNILYTYDSTNNTLTIGYRVVTLTDGKFEDKVTGITYQVKDNTLYVSKKFDNAGKVTINNIQYIVATDGNTVSYETLYESIFVVWEYDHDNNSETSSLTYWAQWNYKVVDKYNQVTTDDPLEAQDGNIKVKLDWTREVGDATYRFNANTLELFKDTEKLGTAKWVSDINGNRYEIDIKINSTTTTYTIEIKDDTMKFKNGESYYQVGSTELALKEETKQNSSWADKIKLTGLDGQITSLKSLGVSSSIEAYVDGSIIDLENYLIGNNDDDLAGTTHSLKIVYTGNGRVELKYNGNDIKVTFEHFSATNA